ncbi:hypothetical protein [Microterricola pindariensis]|uniref:hypothetical protein n=1 Tax=Microterricola pindariensis TaxID=478010 RepID=UPI001E3275CE|nr:hypothetical protein [Microterricola pindariensis]
MLLARHSNGRDTGPAPGDVYFFDCDKTLYGYDVRQRLPRLAEPTGASRYRLATSWWAGGHEAAAEAGLWALGSGFWALGAGF